MSENSKLKVGFVGWRGLVGSVLMQRMREEGCYTNDILAHFYSTSNVGGTPPVEAEAGTLLLDAYGLDALAREDVIITCQGGDYTKQVYQALRTMGWCGYWIDAASTLRMDNDAFIVLDVVNGELLEHYLHKGGKTLVGGNCTVSLMLMALSGLFREKLIEWVYTTTYQAVSGAGAKQMEELLSQMSIIGEYCTGLKAKSPAMSALELERCTSEFIQGASPVTECIPTRQVPTRQIPVGHIGAPLACSLFPWIDRLVDNGQTREEWKGQVESNKILGLNGELIVDGICARVGVLRCHSQSLLLKLNRDLSLATIEDLIAGAHKWAKVIRNTKEDTLAHLTPAAVSGTLSVPVGRLHKSRLGSQYLQMFTVGDQLLWGAAEPLWRALNVVREHLGK